jgi:hypothetical protein
MGGDARSPVRYNFDLSRPMGSWRKAWRLALKAAGLTRSELRGLKCEGYDGLHPRKRKVVGSIHGALKTGARQDDVFIAPMLRQMLAAYKEEFPPLGAGWVFRGRKNGPLSLDNMSRRDIPQFINGAWFGWHSFRKGGWARG